MKKDRILVFSKSLKANEIYSLASLLESELDWTYQKNTAAVSLAKRIVVRFLKDELILDIKEEGLEYLFKRYL